MLAASLLTLASCVAGVVAAPRFQGTTTLNRRAPLYPSSAAKAYTLETCYTTVTIPSGATTSTAGSSDACVSYCSGLAAGGNVYLYVLYTGPSAGGCYCSNNSPEPSYSVGTATPSGSVDCGSVAFANSIYVYSAYMRQYGSSCIQASSSNLRGIVTGVTVDACFQRCAGQVGADTTSYMNVAYEIKRSACYCAGSVTPTSTVTCTGTVIAAGPADYVYIYYTRTAAAQVSGIAKRDEITARNDAIKARSVKVIRSNDGSSAQLVRGRRSLSALEGKSLDKKIPRWRVPGRATVDAST